jgi:hypothetical protein
LTTQNEQPVDSDTPLTMHASWDVIKNWKSRWIHKWKLSDNKLSKKKLHIGKCLSN